MESSACDDIVNNLLKAISCIFLEEKNEPYNELDYPLCEKLHTYLVVIWLRSVHHTSDPVINNGFPHDPSLIYGDPVPEQKVNCLRRKFT